MNLSQDQLAAFFAVARANNFTKAAESLGLTQSALSHRIRNLETHLEATVFVRSPKGIRLTNAGEKLLQYCRVQHQLEDEFLRELKEPADKRLHGHLRIGGASTLIWSAVTKTLGEFLKHHPDVQVEMVARETAELPQWLRQGAIDLLVTCGRISGHDVEEVLLGQEKNVMAEAINKTARTDIYLDQDPKDKTTMNYLKFQGHPYKNLKRSYMDNINGIIAGVEAGLGRAVIPLHLLREHRGIRAVAKDKLFVQPIYLYYIRQPFYTRLQKHVIEVLRSGVQNYL